MQAIAAMGLKTNVVGCLALAENAIGEDAQHPHDIVKSYKVGTSLSLCFHCLALPFFDPPLPFSDLPLPFSDLPLPFL